MKIGLRILLIAALICIVSAIPLIIFTPYTGESKYEYSMLSPFGKLKDICLLDVESRKREVGITSEKGVFLDPCAEYMFNECFGADCYFKSINSYLLVYTGIILLALYAVASYVANKSRSKVS